MALLNVNIYSESLSVNTSFTALIPQDIKKNEKIDVLFLLHGYIGNHTDWTRYSRIESYVNEKRIAVIMPSVNNSYYTNQVYGMNYFDYITIELPKIVEGMFNLRLRKENTYIAGLSMGGYGALKAAFTFPNKYQGVASLSGATDINWVIRNDGDKLRNKIITASFGLNPKITANDDLLMLSKKPAIKDLDIYITCGTSDFLYENNLAFEKHLIANNIKHTYVFNKGAHDWDYWDYNIKLVLNHFFK